MRRTLRYFACSFFARIERSQAANNSLACCYLAIRISYLLRIRSIFVRSFVRLLAHSLTRSLPLRESCAASCSLLLRKTKASELWERHKNCRPRIADARAFAQSIKCSPFKAPTLRHCKYISSNGMQCITCNWLVAILLSSQVNWNKVSTNTD